MTTYALAATPYGNFDVQLSNPERASNPHVTSVVSFTPIGDLPVIPLKAIGKGVGPVLDHQRLETEAIRQLTERGAQNPSWRVPQCEFTVNRVHYAHRFEIVTQMVPWDNHAERSYVECSWEISDSAKSKLLAWWEKNRADIVTPRFLAETELSRAEYAQWRALKDVTEARLALERADDEWGAAFERTEAAQAKVDAL